MLLWTAALFLVVELLSATALFLCRRRRDHAQGRRQALPRRRPRVGGDDEVKAPVAKVDAA
jgi:hypothetical protein